MTGATSWELTWSGTGFVTAVLLAGVFLVAAIAKLRDRRAVAAQFAAMGLWRPVLLAEVLPWFELVAAGLLIAAPAVGAQVGLFALVAMTVVIGRLVAAGATVPCACFGGSSREVVSTVDLVRNTFLLAGAIVATGAVREVPTWADVALAVGGAVLASTAVAALRRTRRRGAAPRRTS